ncbi:arsenate reductase ArsC [Albidovulum sp.]|uniref:arsenate reductase ArsC n=1 Tax=Albidovulum sp. TaxID=1872424 RepID=UPI0039B9C25F
MNILVLCTGNSARSILLEAMLNARSGGRLAAFSAGSQPKGEVHPAALALLARKGLATGALRSKSWGEFARPDAPRMDAVITVCAAAAAETCPLWPGVPVRAHWGVDDPAAAPEAERAEAFEAAYAALEARAAALLALPLATLTPAELGAALNRIGEG